MDLHSSGNELECHTCSYEDNSGDVIGFIDCADGGDSVRKTKCPKYADSQRLKFNTETFGQNF